jgi:hypothetical protein
MPAAKKVVDFPFIIFPVMPPRFDFALHNIDADSRRLSMPHIYANAASYREISD